MNSNSGFSTLELLITFAVMTLTMSAIVIVAFGNQSLAIDTVIAQRAIYLTEKNLEEAGVLAYSDFDAVAPVFTPAVGNNIYDTVLDVADISECAIRVTSESRWKRGLRELNSSLTTVFVSPVEAVALGGRCVSTEPGNDWTGPAAIENEDIGGQADATAIEVAHGYLYLTTAPAAADQHDLFIYEFNDSVPELDEVGSLNTDETEVIGLNDLVVASQDGSLYAFAASESKTAQLRVIDVTDPGSPIELFAVGLPGVNPLGSQPQGRAIYYYDERVYIGTRETDGNEFHVFDVSALPSSAPTHLGSIQLNHTIRDIVVRGAYAYLATSDNDHELMVIDISDPGSMDHPDVTDLGFNAPGNDDGTAVYVTGQKVYLGRARTSGGTGDDLFILTASEVRDGSDVDDGELGRKDIGLSNNAHISGIAVRGEFAFLSLDGDPDGLLIYNFSDPSALELQSTHPDDDSTGLAMDGSYVFSAHRGGSEIMVISDSN